MMVLFFNAARLALIVLDPWLSSRPLATALLHSPRGELIINHQYYEFSSVFFYTGEKALLLNGRIDNLVYGSYAPGAPQVFIDDADFRSLWTQPRRFYFVSSLSGVRRIVGLVPQSTLNVVAESANKFLITNEPLPNSRPLAF